MSHLLLYYFIYIHIYTYVYTADSTCVKSPWRFHVYIADTYVLCVCVCVCVCVCDSYTATLTAGTAGNTPTNATTLDAGTACSKLGTVSVVKWRSRCSFITNILHIRAGTCLSQTMLTAHVSFPTTPATRYLIYYRLVPNLLQTCLSQTMLTAHV